MTFIGLSSLSPPRYDYTNYDYPNWAIAIGWSVAGLSFLPTPIVLVYVLAKSGFTLKGIWDSFKPSEEWLPNDKSLVPSYKARWHDWHSDREKASFEGEPVYPKVYLPANYFIEHSTPL